MKTQFYPENVFKFCPRCGHAGFIPASTKELHCASCGFTYFVNPAAAVAALITDAGGRLLLTRRRNAPAAGMLDLPGGFVDKLETAEDALSREIQEELNLRVDEISFFGSFPNEYLFEGIVYFTLDIVFECIVRNPGTLRPADDVSSCEWIAPDKINLHDIGLDSVKNIILAYHNRKL
jgi:ADP-ribose pyrophosphatase YjhB (NUDIX family)